MYGDEAGNTLLADSCAFEESRADFFLARKRLFAWSDREHAKLEADRAALERERELLTHEPRGSYGYYEYPREPCCCCIVLYNYD